MNLTANIEQPFPVQFIEAPENEWTSHVKKQVNTNHSRALASPLWRLFVLQDLFNPTKFALIASFHHTAADGLSGVTFFKNFLAIHNNLLAGVTPNNNEIIAPLLEEIVDVRPFAFDLVREIAAVFGPKKKTRTDYLGPLAESAPLSTNTHFTTLREDVLGPLRVACREHKVTLHGAISAAAEFACTKANFPKSFVHIQDHFQLSYDFPVSLRKHLPNANSNFMGLILCGTNDRDVKIRKDSLFWEEAKRINSQMQKFIKEGTAQIGMLEFLPGSWEEFVNKKRVSGLPNKRVASIELSNLGQIDFSHENSDTCQVEEFTFVIPNHITGPVFCNAAATVGNIMNIATTTPAPVITEDVGEFFQEALLSALLLACKKPFFKFSEMYL